VVVAAAAVCEVAAPEDIPAGPVLDEVSSIESVVPEAESVAELGGAVEDDGEEGVPPVEVVSSEIADEDADFAPSPIARQLQFNLE
jgi:hypothetical protein